MPRVFSRISPSTGGRGIREVAYWARLQRRAAELDATIRFSADGLVTLSSTGDIVHMNPAAARILGLSSAERALPLEQRLTVLRPETPEGRPFPIEEMPTARALRGETPQAVEVVLHRPPDRTIWVVHTSAPIRNADDRLLGAVSSFADITRLRALRWPGTSHFRSVSPDPGNSPFNLAGQAQLIRQVEENLGMAMQIVDCVMAGTLRQQHAAEGRASSGRLEPGQERTGVCEADLRTALSELLGPVGGITCAEWVVVEIKPGLPALRVDPDHLRCILANLLASALACSLPDSLVCLRAERASHEAKISVECRGLGITRDDIPHSFEVLPKPGTPAKRDATRAGLYVARTLVEVHGGRVWVEGDPRVGFTFFFTLPVVGPGAAGLEPR